MLTAADPSACRAARFALSAVITAWSARTAAALAAPALGGQQLALADHLAQADPDTADPARPAVPKLRPAMPLLLTTPVSERLLAARIDDTYSAMPTSEALASKIPPSRRARPVNFRGPSASR